MLTMEVATLSWQSLISVSGLLLTSSLILEVYYRLRPILSGCASDKATISFVHLLQKTLSSRIASIKKIAHDFRSRHYYIPWAPRSSVIIRSVDHIHELSETPELDQRAVFEDLLGVKHAIKYSELPEYPRDRAPRTRLLNYAIKVLSGAQIATLQPYLQTYLERTLHKDLDSQLSIRSWTTVKLAPMMRKIASGMLGVWFFGELLDDVEFNSATERYGKETMNLWVLLQMIPTSMVSLAFSVITKNGQALGVLHKRLARVMVEKEGRSTRKGSLESITLLHNMIEASKGTIYEKPRTLAQAVVGLWFAASHQPWMNLHFIFLELCARPEYIQLLRQEISGHGKLDHATICSLPILDSFIKECIRLNPPDILSIRRKAMKPYQFSNGGPRLETGQVACVQSYDILHDEARYPNPYSFDGLRFVKDPSSVVPGYFKSRADRMRGTTFTEGTKDYTIWGLGTMICPGKRHASLIIKMVLVHFLLNYDFRLEDKKAARFYHWEAFKIPYMSTKVQIRKREMVL